MGNETPGVIHSNYNGQHHRLTRRVVESTEVVKESTGSYFWVYSTHDRPVPGVPANAPSATVQLKRTHVLPYIFSLN